MQRHLRPADRLIGHVDQALRTLVPGSVQASRPRPGREHNPALSVQEARQVAALMRVNHSGEVCAQALYQGQALTARLSSVRAEMQRAAQEEQDHLHWCESRLNELGSHPSLLNPLWYGMSFALGAAAGLAGDAHSLGFVAETERQVMAHLQAHLDQIPAHDQSTRALLQQMHDDEAHHREQALAAGGRALPPPVQGLMALVSKLMTHTSNVI